MTDGSRPKFWDTPTAVWLYGFLRATAFGVPAATGTGGYGIGALVVLVLFVFLVRGSRPAWVVLVVLDVLAFVVLLIATPVVEEAPLILHILQALALVALLWPSTRRHVSPHRRRKPSLR